MATTRESAGAAELAASYLEAFAARDLEAAIGHWQEQGILDEAPVGVFRGVDEIRAWLAELFAAIPDLEAVPGRVTGSDRFAAAEWRMSGTFSGGPLAGLDATGAHLDLRGVDCVEVEEGRIARVAAYYDGAAFARAVGLLPPRDSASERALFAAFNGATRLRRIVRDQLDR